MMDERVAAIWALIQRPQEGGRATTTREDAAYLVFRYEAELKRRGAAEAGLMHYWSTQTCPCGARIESPNTHPHVGGCPVGLWQCFVEGP